jgi:monoamine oxidase
MSITDYLSSKGIKGWLFELLEKAFTAEYGLEATAQSSLNLLTMLDASTAKGLRIYGNSDERYKIRGGNRLLINKLTEAIAPAVSFNHRCVRISYSGELYKLEFNGQPTQYCKYLLITIPFTALRKIQLDLELPDRKKRVIQDLHYGTNSKIVFGFTEAVWEDQGKSGYLFSSKIQNGWDSSFVTADRSLRSFTIFQGGQPGKDMSLSEASDYLTYLDTLFPGVLEKHNKRVAVFNWFNSSLSMGSYAVYRVGDWTKLAGLEFEPVGNMHFAGEHCSENFKGYMNGAAETGRIAAEQLIAKMAAL